ncbi:MAG: trimeric intracellular cation channel family protein [Eubacteriales bacterium]|nr:trimeric intracellular cation channel family protein [Eubacteriales bacterium]
MDIQTLTFVMEIIGTISFAASGAMIGIQHKMDVFGVSVLGVITSVGGGMMRDLVLGIIPPNVFVDPIYALIASIVSVIIFLIAKYGGVLNREGFKCHYDRSMWIMDTIGLGIFTAVGVSIGVRHGYLNNAFLLVFLGTISGVGGGVIRDIMANEPPYILYKHIYACASIVGAIVCVIGYRNATPNTAMIISSLTVMLIRFLAIWFKWNLPSIK